MTIKVLSRKELAEAAFIWQYLETKVSNAGLTSRWDWVKTWLDNYKDTVDFWFAIGIRDNQPCGIVLITREIQRPLPLPVKALHFGTNGEPYKEVVGMVNNRFLIIEEAKELFWKNLIETIRTTFEWEEMVFDSITPKETKPVISALTEHQFKVAVHREPCLYFDLTQAKDSGSEVLDSLGYNTRYSIRRSLKAFNGDLKTEWAEDTGQALDILKELVSIYQSNWEKMGRAGMFSSTRFSSFQKDILSRLIPKKSAILFRVTSKQYGTLGCLYLFVDQGTAFGYQLGLNDFTNTQVGNINNKRLKIGFIVHVLCMQECLKRGIKSYNFSTGIYPYKEELTNKRDEVVTISVSQNFKPRLRNSMVSLYNRMNEDKKSSLLINLLHRFV